MRTLYPHEIDTLPEQIRLTMQEQIDAIEDKMENDHEQAIRDIEGERDAADNALDALKDDLESILQRFNPVEYEPDNFPNGLSEETEPFRQDIHTVLKELQDILNWS